MGNPFCMRIYRCKADVELVADRDQRIEWNRGGRQREGAAAKRALRDAVLGLPQAQMAGTAAMYYSIGSEPGTHGLVYALWKRGTYVLLPVLRPDLDLDWASYEGPESLRPGPRGLTEPAEPPRGTGAVSLAD